MIGIIISILFLISGIPQSIKLIKTKKSNDISLTMYIITIGAVILSITASINPFNLNLLISNSVSLTMLSFNLFLIIRYRNNRNTECEWYRD